jgi:hypothetical protein
MDDVLRQLTPEQALHVIRRLYEKDARTRQVVLATARSVLEAVDLNETAEEVFFLLDSISVEHLWDRSGPKRGGYTSPDQAAVDIIEEKLESFFDQVRKYRQLGMFPQEKTYCMGILLGIYRFDQESRSEFRHWAVDVPVECFGYLLNEWRKGCQNADPRNEMDEFVKNSCPKWAEYFL